MTQQVRRTYRNHRRGAWAAVLFVMSVALAAMLVVALGSASAAPDKKEVSASFSPSSWARGSTVSPDLKIENKSGSQELGSADLCIPDGFDVTVSPPASVELSSAFPGTPCSTTKFLKLRDLAIAANFHKTISLRVAVPCSAAGTYWELYAKQSNDFNGPPGNNFQPNPFHVLVTYTGSCTLTFETQPSQTSNYVDPSTSPPVSYPLVAVDGSSTIQVKATTGAGVPVEDVPVTITSTAATTSGGAETTNVSGIASFSSLRVGPDGGEYTLTASAPGFTSVTSNGFFVFTQGCTSSPCTVTKQLGGSTEVTVTQSGFDGPIGVLVDSIATVPGDLCGGGTITGDDFRIEIRPYTEGLTEITWRYTKDKRLKNPNNGQFYELCVGTKVAAGYPVDPFIPRFPVQNLYPDPDGDYLADEYPSGSDRFWGVLTAAAGGTKCNDGYSYTYPTKIAEYASGADAIQVACFPWPFDPWGAGMG